MNRKDIILLESLYISILENKATAKQYLQQGKLSEEDYNKIVNADKTPTKKYVGWMAKQWINQSVDNIDILRNTVEDFELYSNKIKQKDIYQYASFDEVKKEIDYLKRTGKNISKKEQEQDYNVIVDNEDLLIIAPHTHAASRKLGLSHFAYRDCEGGGKDSAWCTAFKDPSHFNNIYFYHGARLLYIKVRSKKIKRRLEKNGFGPEYTLVALTVYDHPDDITKAEAFNAENFHFAGPYLDEYLDILDINFRAYILDIDFEHEMQS